MSSKMNVREELTRVLVRYGHAKDLRGELDLPFLEDLAQVAERYASEERGALVQTGGGN